MTFKRGYWVGLNSTAPEDNVYYMYWQPWFAKILTIDLVVEHAVLIAGYSVMYITMWMSRKAASSSECTKTADIFRTTKSFECLVPVVSQKVQKYT
jgi:hypothetical protein